MQRSFPSWKVQSSTKKLDFLAQCESQPVCTLQTGRVALGFRAISVAQHVVAEQEVKAQSFIIQYAFLESIHFNIVPGLTGGSDDTYVRHMLLRARRHGWHGVVFNSRGCADSPVTSPQFYSASFTEDLRQVVKHVAVHFPESNMYAIGWSLGSNILVRYLGETSRSSAGKLWAIKTSGKALRRDPPSCRIFNKAAEATKVDWKLMNIISEVARIVGVDCLPSYRGLHLIMTSEEALPGCNSSMKQIVALAKLTALKARRRSFLIDNNILGTCCQAHPRIVNQRLPSKQGPRSCKFGQGIQGLICRYKANESRCRILNHMYLEFQMWISFVFKKKSKEVVPLDCEHEVDLADGKVTKVSTEVRTVKPKIAFKRRAKELQMWPRDPRTAKESGICSIETYDAILGLLYMHYASSSMLSTLHVNRHYVIYTFPKVPAEVGGRYLNISSESKQCIMTDDPKKHDSNTLNTKSVCKTGVHGKELPKSPGGSEIEGGDCPLSGAVSLCNPFNLGIADEDFHKGFNNVYDKALARGLRKILKKHERLFEGIGGAYNIPLAAEARSVRDFDEGLTRVSFGYKSVDDYYSNSSSSDSVKLVRTSLLCIQAENDPIAPSRGIPREDIKLVVNKAKDGCMCMNIF
eukprot:Gb_02180 [translate_table: standard]